MIAPPPVAVSAASELVGKPVVVHCEHIDYGNGAENGLTYPNGYQEETRPVIFLSLDTCQGLYKFLTGRTGGQAVGAVLTLAHEAAHATGVYDEAAAECRAYKTAPRLIRLLGRKYDRDVRITLTLAHGLNAGNPGYYDPHCKT